MRPSALIAGSYVSATATDPAGNTSEFAADTIVVATVYWVNASGGDWDTPSNWSSDSVPTAVDDPVISIAVTNPITHDQSNADSVNSLTSSDPIVLSAGSLAIGTTAALSASLTLDGGTIKGGTLAMTGGATVTAANNLGTLDGVTLEGTLDLATYNNAQVTILDGSALDGTIEVGNANGTTTGALNFVERRRSPVPGQWSWAARRRTHTTRSRTSRTTATRGR